MAEINVTKVWYDEAADFTPEQEQAARDFLKKHVKAEIERVFCVPVELQRPNCDCWVYHRAGCPAAGWIT